MEIRKAIPDDWYDLERIFACARSFMQRTGNAFQWIDGYPSRELVMRDIGNGHCYCVTNDRGKVVGTFACIPGEDPNYRKIEQGCWPDDEPYVTVHRLASDGSEKGVADLCFRWCCSLRTVVRADTHRDNRVVQHILEKYGFRACGVIRVANGTERLGYHRENKPL